jgi:gluconokinase
MDILCFDIGSSGIRGARFNEQLEASGLHESSWNLQRDSQGHATLSVYDIECAFAEVAHALANGGPPAAVSVGCFMHSFLVLSSCCAALTPVFTWLDTSGPEGLDIVRSKVRMSFHKRTGCHYHPMFPIFKLAATPAGRGNRVGSPKAWLTWELTGSFVEDFGMASASGLLNVKSRKWDSDLRNATGLDVHDLPELVNPYSIAGMVTSAGADRFGVPSGIPLVSGSGDGFLANIGSACTSSKRIAVTLGTSAAVRQMLPTPSLDPSAGTFCYRASSEAFLLGCASSNGGNVLDWGRQTFGPPDSEPLTTDLPIFLPWMNGERSLEWDASLRESWHGRKDGHSPGVLSRAVVEGVLFNIAQYVEVLGRESGVTAEKIVLSGNGFRAPLFAHVLASILGRELLHPPSPGLATLLGAAVHGWRALGHDALPILERKIELAARVKAVPNGPMSERFARFKELRGSVSA